MRKKKSRGGRSLSLVSHIPSNTGNVLCCAQSSVDITGSGTGDPSQSNDGAKCGNSQMCLSGQCVDVSLEKTTQCNKCGNQEVCNNAGACHCKSGFSGQECQLMESCVCDVCQDESGEDGNELVFCDSCSLCVHQFCYGIVSIP